MGLPRNAIEFYPVGYVRELKNAGLNDMRMAFLMYWDDYCDGDIQSNRYYATMWSSHRTRAKSTKSKGMSPSTVKDWIDQFLGVINNFEAFKVLNEKAGKQSADSFVQNEIGRIGHSESDSVVHSESTENTEVNRENKNEIGRIGHSESDHIFNNKYTTKTAPASDAEFFYLYQTCRQANANVGANMTAYEAWKSLHGIGWRDLAISYLLYMRDHGTHSGKPYGLARFIENAVYLSYTMPYVKVIMKNRDVVTGFYDMTKGVLTDDIGRGYSLVQPAFMAMLSESRVEYLGKFMAKAK